MSDKRFEQLWEIDQRLRKLFPTTMWSNNETIVTIRMFGGFEFFNTRPYHNYENWSSGYEIKTGERYGGIVVTAEDLDDAIKKLEIELGKYEKEKKYDPCPNCLEKDFEKYCFCGKDIQK